MSTFPDDGSTLNGRLFVCLECGKRVRICRCCDRGNRYCGLDCRSEVRRKQKLAAALRYQQTPEGKLNHKKRQQRYLDRREKKMTRQGPQAGLAREKKKIVDWRRVAQAAEAALTNWSGHCCRCGQRLSVPLRRGFVRHPDRCPFATLGREKFWWPPGQPGG